MTKIKNEEQPNNGTGYEWEYAKKIDNRTTGQKIVNFIYNPETHAFMGRTAKSWGALLLFYAIFYSVLALLFAICMRVLLGTLAKEFPKWQLAESIIGTNPGLGFRPMADSAEAASIIWYNQKNKRKWIDAMIEFERKHYTKNSSLAVDCKYNASTLDEGQFCRVSLSTLETCAPRYGFGFGINEPCIFLKLNRIYGWIPEYYNTTESLPHAIPSHTRSKIIEAINKGESNQVWVSCEGQSPHDRDNVEELKYFPAPGFPYYFYPYKNTKDYMSPLVAVQFSKVKAGVLINLECKAWAKNIEHTITAQSREGSVHIELQVDEFKL